jgi:predicted nucleic acid-binding protein
VLGSPLSLDLLRELSLMVDDSEVLPDVFSPDPDDNYLIALASRSRSVLVSGDGDLLRLSHQIPVYSPAEFLRILEKSNHRT